MNKKDLESILKKMLDDKKCKTCRVMSMLEMRKDFFEISNGVCPQANSLACSFPKTPAGCLIRVDLNAVNNDWGQYQGWYGGVNWKGDFSDKRKGLRCAISHEIQHWSSCQ